jgi:hypothetical protein
MSIEMDSRQKEGEDLFALFCVQKFVSKNVSSVYSFANPGDKSHYRF